MAENSKFVAGTAAKYHIRSEKADGNPAPSTAYGTFVALRAAVQYALKSDLKGVRVAIQGIGHVGFRLAQHLYNAGAELIVSDIYKDNAQKAATLFNAKLVSTEDIISCEADVFAPCAMGAIINQQSLETMKAKVITGAANNQLETESVGQLCHDAKVLYAPDYVVNAGGIIDIHHQTLASSDEAMRAHIERISDTLLAIFARASNEQKATNIIADSMAEERFKP